MDKKYLYIALALIFTGICCIAIWKAGNSIDGVSQGELVPIHVSQKIELEKQTLEDTEVIETTNLISVNERGGVALATRSYENGVFTHTVTSDIPAPVEGKFYEGWLVIKGATPRDFFSTGAMEQQSDGSWILTYTSDTNYPNHTFVVITEETSADGFDNNPETHIFEGEFN